MATVFTASHQRIAAVVVQSVTVSICEVHVWKEERFSITLWNLSWWFIQNRFLPVNNPAGLSVTFSVLELFQMFGIKSLGTKIHLENVEKKKKKKLHFIYENK